MPFVKSLWPRLKPEAQKCLREDWVKFGEEPEEGDYYIAVDFAGFEEVNKKRTKNTKLDETAIAVVKVGPDGWYVDNIIYGRWSLTRLPPRYFRPLETTDPVSVGIERGIAKQAVMSPLMDLMKRYGRSLE